MELHGKSPLQQVTAIIPARYASTRLPGKLLLPLAGKPLIIHTLEQALKSRLVDRVMVAADDPRIVDAVQAFGYEAVMTSSEHQSGSDRVAEVAQSVAEGSIVVNVQGDEPTISPHTIDAAVSAMISNQDADIVTTSELIIDPADVVSPDVVKVVTDNDGNALYFSRSPVPFPRDAVRRYESLEIALAAEPELLFKFRKHTGLYVYRREYLIELCRMSPGALEAIEMLEQLRALQNRGRIKVVEVAGRSIGVDTAADLERVTEILAAGQITRL